MSFILNSELVDDSYFFEKSSDTEKKFSPLCLSERVIVIESAFSMSVSHDIEYDGMRPCEKPHDAYVPSLFSTAHAYLLSVNSNRL